ncbi:MAG: DUF2177 family protein [Patescibacteria group bacterium]
MEFMLSVLIGMIVMAVIDGPVIKYVIRPTLESTAKGISRDTPNFPAAIVFYVGYVSMVVYLSQLLGDTSAEVAFYGGLLGLFAYGTYEFTNMAVLKGWSWKMVMIDTVWGVILTSAVATLAYIFTN